MSSLLDRILKSQLELYLMQYQSVFLMSCGSVSAMPLLADRKAVVHVADKDKKRLRDFLATKGEYRCRTYGSPLSKDFAGSVSRGVQLKNSVDLVQMCDFAYVMPQLDDIVALVHELLNDNGYLMGACDVKTLEVLQLKLAPGFRCVSISGMADWVTTIKNCTQTHDWSQMSSGWRSFVFQKK